MSITAAFAGKIFKQRLDRPKRVLIIVQNLPVPFDRRVWQEATELNRNGYVVSIICPKSREYTSSYEIIDGITIYRHPMPFEAKGVFGYLFEYGFCLFWEFWLSCKIFLTKGFDALHACNPPDNIFLIGGFFKYLFGTKFLFDHHDINPELYEAKFGRRDFFYKLLLWSERLTFATADIVISTNNSYRQIAIERGHKSFTDIFVVRSGPDLSRFKINPSNVIHKQGKQFLVGYLGVIGQQEGIGYLLQAAYIIIHDLKRSDMHFTLVGSGPALADMIALRDTLHLNAFVTFTGRLSDTELLDVLNTADICVNPDSVNTMNDKSTMNKIMEYMALAKPIIQFDVTEGRYSAGAASLYAKPNDAADLAAKIIELIDAPERRAAMGAFGRARVENELAWPHEAPKLLAAYNALFDMKDRATA